MQLINERWNLFTHEIFERTCLGMTSRAWGSLMVWQGGCLNYLIEHGNPDFGQSNVDSEGRYTRISYCQIICSRQAARY